MLGFEVATCRFVTFYKGVIAKKPWVDGPNLFGICAGFW